MDHIVESYQCPAGGHKVVHELFGCFGGEVLADMADLALATTVLSQSQATDLKSDQTGENVLQNKKYLPIVQEFP